MTDLAALLQMLVVLFHWRLGWRYVYSARFRASVRASRQGRSTRFVLVESVCGRVECSCRLSMKPQALRHLSCQT